MFEDLRVRKGLLRHMIMHRGKSTFVCITCEKDFPQMYLFSHHMDSPESLLNKHAQLPCLNRKGPTQVGHSMFVKHENALTAVHYLPTLNFKQVCKTFGRTH